MLQWHPIPSRHTEQQIYSFLKRKQQAQNGGTWFQTSGWPSTTFCISFVFSSSSSLSPSLSSSLSESIECFLNNHSKINHEQNCLLLRGNSSKNPKWRRRRWRWLLIGSSIICIYLHMMHLELFLQTILRMLRHIRLCITKILRLQNYHGGVKAKNPRFF
jgi:hypothetical protein